MKYLTLIRHAKSSWGFKGCSDIDRILDDRGKKDAPVMGKCLNEKGISFDTVLSSPAKRARMTGQSICEETGFPSSQIIIDENIYYGGAGEVLNLIIELDSQIKDLAIVGHNPTTEELAGLFTSQYFEKVPTCGVIRISFNINQWSEILGIPGRLEFFISPKKHFF